MEFVYGALAEAQDISIFSACLEHVTVTNVPCQRQILLSTVLLSHIFVKSLDTLFDYLLFFCLSLDVGTHPESEAIGIWTSFDTIESNLAVELQLQPLCIVAF